MTAAPGTLRTSDFEYDLPPELIAQAPTMRREDARLLVWRRGERQHRRVADLVELLEPADLLVVNDTRVRRARLRGRRPGGGAVECLLVERIGGASSRWRALCRPASKLRIGVAVELDGATIVPIERDSAADGSAAPYWIVELRTASGDVPDDEEALIERIGEVPLPPYVRRDGGPVAEDHERYQTVYARELGAVAAPTAGLHLSRELLGALARRGVERASVTLHVGPGTFRPVEVEDPAEHVMHSERYSVPAATRAAIAATRARAGRVIAVGTTVLRTLEAAIDEDALPRIGSATTDIFIWPGTEIRSVDGLLTNFHLPRSTLLMLVCAMAGTAEVLDLYREAVRERYRFYSYGDAMLLLP